MKENNSVHTLPTMVPFKADAVLGYKMAIEEKNFHMEMVFDEIPRNAPWTRGKGYKLAVRDECGLVFVDDLGDHAHLEHKNLAKAVESAGGMIRCNAKTAELLDGYVKLHRTKLMGKLYAELEKFGAVTDFRRGDRVEQLNIMKYNYPAPGDFGLFIGYIDWETKPAGTGECPEDCEVMCLDSDGDVRVFTMNSRYLKHYEGDDNESTGS